MKIFAKKSISIILIAVFVLGLLLPATALSVLHEYACDLNADGKVTAADARALLRYSAGLDKISLTKQAMECGIEVFGDLDGDGKASARDARLLLRAVSKLDSFEELTILTRPTEAKQPQADTSTTKAPTTKAPTTKASQPEAPKTQAPPTPSLPQNQLLSAEDDHGLGTAEMIVVKDDYCETMPAGVDNDRSDPTCTPYSKGTIAYVTGRESFDSGLHYALSSGKKLAADSVTFLKEGYVMPRNELEIVAVSSARDSTDIYIKTNWLVPTCVNFYPQKYFTGYDKRPFNVKEFTAEYIEIEFFNTKSASGNADFSSCPVISSLSFRSRGEAQILRLDLEEKGKFYGYNFSVTENGYYKLHIKHKTQGIAGKTIVLDNGHGGADPGGGSNGVYEAPINLEVVKLCADLLRAEGARVIITNLQNKTMSLAERRKICRENDGDIFISVHCNTTDSSSAVGNDSFYYFPYSRELASLVQQSLFEAYCEIYSEGEKNRPENVAAEKFWPFGVARNESCSALLVELGFLTNEQEREKLVMPEVQAKIAQALASAVCKFFE